MAMKYRISIEVSFGSEIQRDVAMRVLRQFLVVWEANVESAHKKMKSSSRSVKSRTQCIPESKILSV